MQELKAVEILTSIANGFVDFNYKKDCKEAIEELEQYEQNFKNEEFKYRTECQNILSIGRVEADAMPDKLAELEKVISDYYLALGYQVGAGDWCFRVDIMSHYKNKWIYIYFYKNDEEEEVSKFIGKTTKEMFDKSIKHFSARQNEVSK